jgi:hypothetical protein
MLILIKGQFQATEDKILISYKIIQNFLLWTTSVTFRKILMWLIDPLLGKDLETNN